MLKKLKNEKAITLITLVITMVLLMILAGVLVNVALGQNGLLKRAREAKLSMQEQTVKEIIENIILDMQINEIAKGEDLSLKQVAEKLESKDSNITLEEYIEENKELKGKYNLNEEEYSFKINKKLEVQVIGKATKKIVNIEKIEWQNGKAQVTLTSSEQGTIEYKDSDRNWQVFTNGIELENEITLTVRVKLPTGETTKEEKIEIKDRIKPTEFEIEVQNENIKAKSVAVNLKTIPTDNETGIKDYTYVAESKGDKKEIINITATSYKIQELTPKTNYSIYVLAYDNSGNYRKSNSISITTPETTPPTVSVGQDTHTAHNLDDENSEYYYTWEELEQIAKIISDNNRTSITYTTPEITVEMNGEVYTLGVGDYKNVTYEGVEKQVRILGFNHDTLVTSKTNEQGETLQINQYGEGTNNTYAGITFEFVDFIMSAAINSTLSNIGGWGVMPLRTTINSEETINNISIGEKIKEVKKEYNIGNNKTQNAGSPSEDKLWLLACSEIYQTGASKGYAYGFCTTKEGEQYEFYRIKMANRVNSGDLSTLIKPTSANKKQWWLRSPRLNNVNHYTYEFNFLTSKGSNANDHCNRSYGIAPGFCI